MRRITTILLCAALAAACASASRVDAQGCNCGLTGAWVPGSFDAGQGTNSNYSATVTGGPTSYQLTVTGSSGIILQQVYSGAPTYDFLSSDWLVVQYGSAGYSYVTLYDLAAGGTTLLSFVGPAAEVQRYRMSRRGRFLTYGLSGLQHILRASDLQELYTYSSTSQPLWGPDDRSFYYTIPLEGGGSQVVVYNMAVAGLAFQVGFPLFSGGIRFTPCGDAIGITQWTDNTFTATNVEMHGTTNGGVIGSVSFPPNIGPVTYSTSGTEHYGEWFDGTGFQDLHIADNTAQQACVDVPQPASASVSPTHGPGGTVFTLTAGIGGQAPFEGTSLRILWSGPVTGGGSVGIDWGQSSASLQMQAENVYGTPDTVVFTVQGSQQSVTTQFVVDVTPPQLSSLNFNPGSVDAGSPVSLVAVIDHPALAGGASIALTSGDSVPLTLPASIQIPQGATSASIDLTAPPLATNQTFTVTGDFLGNQLQAGLLVYGPTPQSLVSPDACIVGGQTLKLGLTMTTAVTPAGCDVVVTSNDPVHVPTSVPIHFAPGVFEGYVSLPTAAVDSPEGVTVSADLNGVTQTFDVTLQPTQDFYANVLPPIHPALRYYTARANGLNQYGQVTGACSSTSRYLLSAFLWKDGASGEVPRMQAGTTDTGEGFAVNDAGVVVGAFGSEAFRWDGATLTDLAPGAAYSVNAAGKVVGAQNTAGGTEAFLHDGTMHALGTLGGTSSEAHGINTNDVVVGWANTGDGHAHAFRWTQGGGMVDLGLPAGATDAFATAINDAGTVVGYAYYGGYLAEACRWDGSGAQYLDTGGLQGRANAINQAGQVVGVSDGHPVMWDGATRTELDALPGACGWDQYVTPTGINDHGQIVGTWNDGDSDPFAWMLTLGAPPTTAVEPPVTDAAPRSLALSVLGANPVRGALSLRCALPALGSATLELLDVSGRRIASRALPGEGAVQLVRLEETTTFAPGVYFARLSQGGHSVLARVAVVR